MTSLLSYTAPNYIQKQEPGSPLHIPQPFINYGGLSKMLSGDYKYTPRESPYQNIPQEKMSKIKMASRILYSRMNLKITIKKEKKMPKVIRKMKQVVFGLKI